MSDIDKLLYRSESDALDFKRDQYAFEKEDDATKGELLKDILAMANSWRTETGYILIGVREGEIPAKVVGIAPSDHFDDATLQQFVNSKTNRPIRFIYRPIEHNGLAVGIIEVPVQLRPVYLKNDFGRLKQNTVYLRRSSSTAIAQPDEIAEMGRNDESGAIPNLEFAFASPGARELLGKNLCIDPKILTVDEENDLPDHQEDYFSTLTENRDFYRELVAVAKNLSSFRRIGFTIRNRGSQTARSIRVELMMLDPEKQWSFSTVHRLDIEPPQRKASYAYPTPIVGNLADKIRGEEPEADALWISGEWHLTFKFALVQPGRTFWPAPELFVSARKSGVAFLRGFIMADGLPTPSECEINISATVDAVQITLDELETQYDEEHRKRHE